MMNRNFLCLALSAIPLVAAHALDSGKEGCQPRLPAAVLAELGRDHRHIPTKCETCSEVETCLDGYELRHHKCVMKIDEPAKAHHTFNIPHIYTCPPDFELVDAVCVKPFEKKPSFFCPLGSEDDGSYGCVFREGGVTELRCCEGELINKSCSIIERAEYIVRSECPEGSVLESDGDCWQVIGLFDCEEECHDCHDECSGHGCHKGKKNKWRRLGAKKASKCHGKEPVPEIKELVAVSSPMDIRIDPIITTQCEKKVRVDAFAILSCPEGFADDGLGCVRQRLEEAEEFCATTGNPGPCPVLTRRVPKTPLCANGTPLLETGLCIEYETIPATARCPEGFIDTGIACAGTLNESHFECAPGLTLVGDRCIGEVHTHPIKMQVTLKACDPDGEWILGEPVYTKH